MDPQSRFISLTPETAPAPATRILQGSQRQFGFLPSPLAKAAHAPLYLKHLLAGFEAFERTSLSATEREVVALSVAREQGCEYCMAMHSALLAKDPEHGALLAALRDGTAIAAKRLEALRAFVVALVKGGGRVPDELFARVRAAGFTQEQCLEILLGVGVYFMSTAGNALTQAELDAPFAAFAWQPQASTAA